jgi:outer membrane protein
MMNTHKILWSLLAIFLATSFIAKSAAAGDVKIAFVDLRRALMETNEGKKALKKLTKQKAKMQKGIEKKEKQILEMKTQIEKQQNILNKEALQKKVEKYYQSVTELQQTYMQFQKELSAKEGKATQSIFVKMQKILKDMGQSGGYTMIYDSSSGAVVWAPKHLDLTDKLIKLYNTKNK